MKIAVIYNKANQYNTAVFIEEVIRESGIRYEHFFTQDAASIPRQFDLYLRIDHGDYKHDLPGDLHPAVFYAIDTHLKKPYRKIRQQARHYDIVFCAQQEAVKRLRKEAGVDAVWLPLGYNSKIIGKLDLPKKYDIAFVGRDAQKFARGKQLKLLKKKYPNSFIGQAPYTKIPEIYSSAKIGFNSCIRNDINVRTFEIMACGSMLMTNLIKGNGFSDIFQDKRHCVVYRNDRELLELIDYYLDNESVRERIAQAGCQLVTERYSCLHLTQKMFSYIAFKLGGNYNDLRI
ncbi:MAG: glycosyltransferase [Candidatus Omnitrophica bacterium]|nr:glycosyltransferase [Candidatus Omnitrophota bacterium]